MSGLRQNTLEKTDLLEQIRKVLSVVNKKRGKAPDGINCRRELRLFLVTLWGRGYSIFLQAEGSHKGPCTSH